MTRLAKELTHLEAVGLIKLVQTHPELEYLFRHALIQEAAYNSLLFEDRKKLHRQVGEAIEQTYPNRLEELASTLADHFIKANEVEKAIHYLLLAGDQARGLYAHQEAIKHYRQALEFLKKQEDYERAARTQMKLGLTHQNAFDFHQARQAYEAGFALWQKASEVETAAPPPAPHALRLVWSEPLTLDPTLAGDFNSASIIDQLFSGLVEEGPDKDVVPAVAQSWEVLDGGRKYIFHLRPDVRWSDGTPVTAQDFEYAWKRALAPATGSPIAELLYDVKGARAFHQGEVSTPDQVGVKALDEITLVVELEEPTGYFLQLMTHNISYPVPQHIVTTCGENWTMVENIVTNGPFRLESWNEGGPIILTRNPTYYGRFTGNLRCIEIIPAVNTATTLEMYEATDLDVLDFLVFSPVERDTARQRYAGEYVSIPGLTVYYLGFNTNCRAFTDPRVRRAFAMAITKERLGDVERGYAFLGSGGFIPPGMPGHSAGIGLPFDVEQARRLLEEAGYPNGRGFPAVELLAMANARAVRECELLQAQWREHLGVEISWQTLEWAAYLDRLRKDLPPAFLMGWKADYPDPDNFLRAAVFNDQDGWHNPTYQRQVEEARRLTDQPARMKLYQQADRILIEEAVKVPLYYERNHLLVKPWVKKYPISAVKTWFYKDVIIESH